MVPQYKIGDVSKILGISPDLLRYYEKKGIVRPQKDKTNDYRYYEAWDINFLIECLWYKQYGFGLAEVERIIAGSSFDELLDILSDKQDELIAEIISKEMLLKNLHTKMDMLEQVKGKLDTFAIERCPEGIAYSNRRNFQYDESREMRLLGQEWSRYFPFICRFYTVEEQVVLNRGSDISWGYLMPAEYEEALEAEVRPPVKRIVSQRCVHTVIRQEGKYNFAPPLLYPMAEYAKKQGLTICGAAWGTLLCSVREHGVMTGYFDAWLPVKES